MSTDSTDTPVREGDIVRYAGGCTALAKLLSPHAGGWHAEHCLGGILFVSRFTKATQHDILEAQKSRFYIWEKIN